MWWYEGESLIFHSRILLSLRIQFGDRNHLSCCQVLPHRERPAPGLSSRYPRRPRWCHSLHCLPRRSVSIGDWLFLHLAHLLRFHTDEFPTMISWYLTGFYCVPALTIAGNAASSKTACPEGYYCPNGTGYDWKSCPAGTYSNVTGLSKDSECTPCPGGHYCQGKKSTHGCLIGNCVFHYKDIPSTYSRKLLKIVL